MLIAERMKKKNESFKQSEFSYWLDSQDERWKSVKENSEYVDGIGGVIWDGAIIMCRFLENILDQNSNCHMLELGCGAGLCGIVSAFTMSSSAQITLTDRYTDLCKINIECASKSHENRICKDTLAVDLEWNSKIYDSILRTRGSADIIVGAEICCLYKQQDDLIDTIIAFSHPQTLVLLSFDDKPPPNNTRYEIAMNEKLRARKYLSSVVYTACINWRRQEEDSKDNNSMISKGYIEDLTDHYRNGLTTLSLHHPSIAVSNKYMMLLGNTHQDDSKDHHNDDFDRVGDYKHSSMSGNKEEDDKLYSLLPPVPPPPPLSTLPQQQSQHKPQQGEEEEKGLHHIVAYFQPTAVNTCCRCNKRFFLMKALNLSTSCRFHKGYYVCRKHPGETKCSIDGKGDALGYYGNGNEGWEAKFWDCCGSEDPDALGCMTDCHQGYS